MLISKSIKQSIRYEKIYLTMVTIYRINGIRSDAATTAEKKTRKVEKETKKTLRSEER